MLLGYRDSRLLLLALAAGGAELTGSALVRLWNRFSLKGRMSQRLRELESSGQITRSGAGRIDQRVYRITGFGRRHSLGELNPPMLWEREWDGKWRLVLFDIPEHKNALRAKLRRHLRESRFGWLQNSVWISPDVRDDFFATIETASIAADSLTVLEARPIGGESDADLVQGAWDFARIATDYQSYRKILRDHPAPTSDLKAWMQWLKVEQAAWKAISARDPFLPERLLPEGYAGRAAWSERTRAYETLGANLRRHATVD